MSRAVSTNFRRAAFAAGTDQVLVPLLSIDHAELTTPIRVAGNTENIISRGNEYIGFGFEIDFPNDSPDGPTRVRLAICNVDRWIVATIRSLGSAPSITLELVLAGTPDVVDAGPWHFTLRDAKYNALVVEGELSYEDILNEPVSGDAFTPSQFPGLF